MSNKELHLLKKKSIAIIVLFGLFVGFFKVANIFAAFSASNVLGQVSGGGGPVYDSGVANNSILDFYGQFSVLTPGGSAFDTISNRLFTVDTSGNRILVYEATPDGNLVDHYADFVLGQSNFTGSGAGTTDHSFSGPRDVAVDVSDRKLFVSDTGNNRVLVFNLDDISNGASAIYVIGQDDFVSSSTGTTDATFSGPSGIDVDTTNRLLYVADTTNNRVMQFDVAVITNGESASNLVGQNDFISSTAGSTIDTLSSPLDVAVAGSSVAVADYANNRVMIFDIFSAGMDARDVLGQPDFVTTSINCMYGSQEFCGPVSVAYDSVNSELYVSDSLHNRVMAFHDTTTYAIADLVVGYEDFNATAGQMSFTGQTGYVSVSPGVEVKNKLIVSDTNGYRFVLFDMQTPINNPETADVVGQVVNGVVDLVGTTLYYPFNNQITAQGIATNGSYADTAIDKDGHRLFVTDPINNRVLVYNLNSSNVPIDRTADYVFGQSDFISNEPGLTQSSLNNPVGLAFYQDVGKTVKLLFVADRGNSRVMVFDVEHIASGANASHVLGQLDFESSDLTLLSNVMGLSVDTENEDLYVANGEQNNIVLFDISTIVDGEDSVFTKTIPSSGGFVSDIEYFTDSSHHSSYLAISTMLGVQLWSIDYGQEHLFHGQSPIAYIGYSGGDTPLLLDNSFPSHVTFSSGSEILYVSDVGHNRVLGYDMTTFLTNQTDPGDVPVSVFGQNDYVSSSGGTSQSQLFYPRGLAIDPVNNRLWVVDSNNNRVLSFDMIRFASATYPATTVVESVQGTSYEVTGISQILPPGFNTTFPFSSASTSIQFQRGIPLVYKRTFSYYIKQVKDVFDVGIAFYSNKNYPISGSSTRYSPGSDTTPEAYTATATYQSTLQYAVDFAIDTNHHKLYALTNYDGTTNVLNNEIWTFNLNSDNSFNSAVADTRFGDADRNPQTNTLNEYNIAYGSAMAFDSVSNQMFVADAMNNRVLVYSTLSTPTYTTPAAYVLGQANFTSNTAATTQSGMRYPGGLAVDESRRKLFVSDTGNNRVLVYDITSISNGENAQYVLGQDDFTTRTYSYTATNKMTSPTDLEFDQTTKMLYVNNRASINNGGRIQKFDTNSITNGEVQVDYFDGTELSILFTHFNSIAYDPETQRVFAGMTSSSMDMVLILNSDLDFPLMGDNDTFDVSSNAGWIGSNSPNMSTLTFYGDDNDSSHFVMPYLTFDPSNRTLYLADAGNEKTMIFDFVHITKSSLASGDTGVAYSDTLTVENNQGTVTYSVSSGSLPTGLTLDSSTGEISGTPTVAGTYTFTIDAKDKVANRYPNFSDTNEYTVLVTQTTPPAQCNDSIDNDGDGLTDYPSDPGCTSDADDDESNSTGGGSPSVCSDHLDNDGDGLTDYPSDPGCATPGDSSEVNTVVTTPQCSDGIDNDGDGNSDYPNDIGCASLSDDSEVNVTYSCSDGIDNDGDGLTDYPSDPGCFYLTDNDETDTLTPVVYVCSDSIDNDGDGLTDYPSDPGCTSSTDTSEYNQVITPPIDTTPTDDTPPSGGGGETPTDTTPPEETPPQDVPDDTESPQESEPQVLSGGDGCFDEITSVTPFGEVVIIQVRGTWCEVQHTLEDTGGYILQVVGSNENSLAKIIAIVGLVMGALFNIVPYLFLTPFSFSEVGLLPYRLWSLLMSIFGLKKQVRPWGTVYDAITKQPLDPAVVELLDLEGRPVATSTTDIDGRYGFLVGTGKYRLLPKKTHYAFPSLKMIGKTRDELYLDLYFGYVFEITREGEVITKNIPMDPENFDWNEFAKNQQKKMRFYSKRDFVINKIADFFFSIGFTVSIVALISAPIIYNIVIFSLYVVTLILREIGLKHSSFGQVKDADGNPLSFAIVRIKLGDGTEISHKVTNNIGRFYCLLQNGTYIVTIERKNPDESYTQVYEKIHVIKNGVLKGEIRI